LNRLSLHPIVLSKAGPKVLAVKPQNWGETSHRFLKRCVNAGNVDACYTLGMVRHFYYFSCVCFTFENENNFFYLLIFYLFFAIDPILLSSKSKEWTIAYSEGGNEDARAGVILTRCDSVQRKRWH
jgi:hypothetical protein